ncbi:hypothetical protein GCM10007853_26720 [Algimonas ampicilliniresistens]|uniref:DUF924 domain-containing protein n=1 Tax=Algimonas ampicilliniresistens TaxID=1298735 RepID=A0ABQ5VBC8_9PROT|nr:DUF924 family protein [Algimonas ampicilliniresistens]GLQ24798.1 hypothetical protein GCM10007853_26720 [Algimonas ampicilliniresistens]
MITPSDVLDFWFADETKAHWFNSTPSFDAEISQTFQAAAETLAKGPFPHPVWEADAQSALALIIMLDQFPRNMFRGSPRAFAWDGHALGVTDRMVDSGWDLEIPTKKRSFVYMPLMHAEDLTAQNRCVELSGSRLDDGGSTLRHAKAHRDVIEKFRRFPYRNAVLGRDSTPEEYDFLKNGGYDPS